MNPETETIPLPQIISDPKSPILIAQILGEQVTAIPADSLDSRQAGKALVSLG